MVLAMVMIPAMDICAKWLTASLSPGQIAFSRLLLQSLILLPLVWGKLSLDSSIKWHMLRGVMMACVTLSFFTALIYMPVADALAIFFIEPLLLILLSALLLKEQVGQARLIACLIGFAGALLIIGPSGQALGWAAALPMLTALLFALYLIITRRQSKRGEGAVVMLFWAGASGALFLLPLLAIGHWLSIPLLSAAIPNGFETGLLLLIGVVGTGCHFLISRAFALVETPVLAPLQYLEIASATLFGWLVFSDFPAPLTWLGIAIIIASGLYISRYKGPVAA